MHATAQRRSVRVTIAALLVLIGALSLLLLVAVPLVRLGPPPCLGPLPTARWLVARPGSATCADCHAGPAVDLGFTTAGPALGRTRTLEPRFPLGEPRRR